MRHLSQPATDRKLIESFDYNAETGAVFRRKTGELVGSINKAGYLRVSFSYKSYYLHRIVWLLHFGFWPLKELDHVNGIKTDNRIVNLREVTRQENACNRKPQVNNRSGVPGVYWVSRDKVWRAAVQYSNATWHLGSFQNKEDAIAARAAKLSELHGRYARR